MTAWLCRKCGWSCPATPASVLLVLLHDEQDEPHQIVRQPVIPAKNDATR